MQDGKWQHLEIASIHIINEWDLNGKFDSLSKIWDDKSKKSSTSTHPNGLTKFGDNLEVCQIHLEQGDKKWEQLANFLEISKTFN